MADFKEGIYLAEKKGELGIGQTASSMTYKNLYAVRQAGEMVEVCLLNEHLKLTGLREQIPMLRFRGAFKHQPEMQDTFEALKPDLGPLPKPKAAGGQASARGGPSQRSQAGNQDGKVGWDGADESDAKKPWWEVTRLGAETILNKK